MAILGAVTMFFGIIAFFVLIDNPRSRFLRLTDEQKQIVEERLRDNAVVKSKETKYYQIYEALTEPRYYLFIFASCLINLQNGALNTFSSIITQGFGFSVSVATSIKFLSQQQTSKLLWSFFSNQGVDSILLQVPSGVVDCIYIVAAIWWNRKYGNTLYIACVMMVFTMIGLILLIAIPLPKAKLLGLYLCWAYCAGYTMLLTSVANNVSGYTKKIFYSVSIIVLYTVSAGIVFSTLLVFSFFSRMIFF